MIKIKIKNLKYSINLCCLLVFLAGCGVIMPDGSDETCDTSYRQTVVAARVDDDSEEFKIKAYLEDIAGSNSRDSRGSCHGDTENKHRLSSEKFELNICTLTTDSQEKYILETRQEIFERSFSTPKDAVFAIKNDFGESHSGEWSGFQIKFNERSGKPFVANATAEQLITCSPKFKSEP